MNLFCFTLDSSTDSIYEPPYSQTFKEVLPKYQCSPGLHRPEWGGSDPAISSDSRKAKRNNRSCVPESPLDNDGSDRDMTYTCWTSSGDKKELSYQKKETSKSPCQSSMLTRDDTVKEIQTRLPAQIGTWIPDTPGCLRHMLEHVWGGETAASELIYTTARQNKLQNLVQTKRRHQSGAGRGNRTSEDNDVLCTNNPVLTCIGLGKIGENQHSQTIPSPQQQQPHQTDNVHEVPVEEEVWSPWLGNYLWNPFECPQPWTPFYHTCHQPQHDLLVCGGTLSLPRMKEWDHFESLIQELDGKQPNLQKCTPPLIRSITDLQLSQTTLTRFGGFDAFRQPSPLMKPQDNGSTVEQKSNPTKEMLQRTKREISSHMGRKQVDTFPERTQTAIMTISRTGV